jgi:ribonuclease P protein component
MERIRRRADFLAAAGAARAGTPAFAVQSRPRDDEGQTRVGFTVTRKIGTAVERNRIRRRLRALVGRLDRSRLTRARDLVLVGRRGALHRDFDVMLDDLRSALDRLDGSRAGKSSSRQPASAAPTNNDAS